MCNRNPTILIKTLASKKSTKSLSPILTSAAISGTLARGPNVLEGYSGAHELARSGGGVRV